MSFCKELDEEKNPKPMPGRKFNLEDRVAAMDWDMTGVKSKVDSLSRSRWRYRLLLLFLAVAAYWRWLR